MSECTLAQSRVTVKGSCQSPASVWKKAGAKTTQVESHMATCVWFIVSYLLVSQARLWLRTTMMTSRGRQLIDGMHGGWSRFRWPGTNYTPDSAHELGLKLSPCMCSHSSCPDWQQTVTNHTATHGLCAMTQISIICSLRLTESLILSTWGAVTFEKPKITPQDANLIVGIREEHKLIQRPEGTLHIKSDWIFVNGMVHLPQEWNFGTPTILPSPATPPSPLTATPEVIFPLMWCHTFNILCIKSSLCVLSALPCFGLILCT